MNDFNVLQKTFMRCLQKCVENNLDLIEKVQNTFLKKKRIYKLHILYMLFFILKIGVANIEKASA